MKPPSLVCGAALLLALSALSADAQVGSSTDIIIGQVVGPDSQPLAGARIEVMSIETSVTRRRATDSEGRFTIVFPDGGGSYRLTVAYLGMAPRQLTVTRQGDEDRLEANVVMGRIATQLAAVEVRAQQGPRQQPQRPEAGSNERGLPPAIVNRLPVDAGDLNALAALAAGVTSVAGTDSTRASFSVAGQPPDQNSITLDGLSFGAGSVPQEAVRGTRVVTNTYDVARGQFTGGQVSSTTRGGTNTFQGALNYSMRDPSLEFIDDETSFGRKYRQNQISGGFGGPIIKDKLFVFGALQWNRRTDDVLSLLEADPITLQRLGTSPDSVERFLDALDQFGLPPRLAAPTGKRVSDNASALVRFDYNLADAHTLTVRGDWRGSLQEPSRISPLAVPHTGGETKGSGGGAMATMTSNFGNYINELRAYTSVDKRDVTSYISIPDGRVTVASILEDGSRSVSNLQFGGNPSLPQETRSSLYELTNEISKVSRSGGHRFKLGLLANEERSSIGFIPNRFGTFSFNSLADFTAGTPASFTRTLFARDNVSAAQNAALYFGDSWRKSRALQLTYGVRVEGTRYPREPAANSEVESLFGRNTGDFPTELHISPRIGFSFSRFPELGGQPTITFRGGVGEFRGRAASQIFATARNATGLSDGQQTLSCVGTAVPVPDWDAYLADPSTIPTSCAGGNPVFASQRRSVTLFSPEFGAPRAWRASLGASRRMMERFNVSLDASYARGVSQTGTVDLNLDTLAKFTLANEGGRPVYVAPATIVPTTGATSLAGSRLHTQYGRVNEIVSEFESDTRQITLALNGLLMRGIQFNTSYTFTSARDQAQGFSSPSQGGGGFGGGGTTAGNPNRAEWGPSDIARRHSMLATIMYNVKPWLDVSVIARAVSGSRYAPSVGGDVNGDGSRNDRAFIFDPASAADPAVSAAMTRLLASTSEGARECLEKQLGQIASRGSCAAPWTPSLDLQFNFKPASFGLDRRLTISVLTLNTLTGVDQLLHGSDNLRGWGQPAAPDRTLLYVRGFDPATNRYRYEVNENFGVSNSSRNAFRVPFQIALQARLSLGQDPARAQFQRVMGGGPGGQQQNPDQLRARMARAIPNPFREILEVADSVQLALTPEQKTRLEIEADSLQVKADTLISSIASALGTPERNAEPMQIMQRLQPRIQQGRQLAAAAVRKAQTILTPEQWAKLPERIRQPFNPRGGEGGGRPQP